MLTGKEVDLDCRAKMATSVGGAEIASIINRNNENIFDYDDLLTEWFGARDDTDSDEPSSDNDSDDGKLLF